jgi:short-subunit dehydrogenase
MSKNVLIIGATSGIGRRLAELYAESGCIVGIIGRREHLLNEVQQKFPANIYIKKADITNENIGQSLNELIDEMNGTDVIVISASLVEFNEELLAEYESKTVETNVTGFARVINLAWHYFKNKGSGQIVAITSIAAARGNKSAPAYNASKAFQSYYTDGLRLKANHEKNKIIITELIPGYVNSDMGKGDRMFWVSSVDKAARLAKKAIGKKKRRAFIPKRWWWVYHILKLLPTFIHDVIINSSWKLKRKT